jgi:hypothetical protein
MTTESRETAVAYLEITLQIDPEDRAAAAAVYSKYKAPFLRDVAGAQSKDLLVRDEDVQVLHGFDSVAHANAYLASDLFTGDVVGELGPLLNGDPDIRVFEVA